MVMDGRGKGKRMEDQERQRINKTPKAWHLFLLNEMKESPELDEGQKDAIKWILNALEIAKEDRKARRKRRIRAIREWFNRASVIFNFVLSLLYAIGLLLFLLVIKN